MRVLISGAGGFVGRHLAVAMARDRHDVVALVRRTRPAILGQHKSLSVESADLAGAEPLPAAPFDAVIHCAAAIPATVPDETELVRINVDGSRRLFEHAVRAGAGTLIFCSSMSVYGRIEDDVVDPGTSVREPNAYGRSKLECERLLAELSRAHAGFGAVSIRLPGVVGLGSHDNFLSDTMARLRAGEAVVARNPDALFNSIVHIDDLSRFVSALLGSLPCGHRAITIGAGSPLPIRDIVGLLEAAAGRIDAVSYEHGGHSFLISSEHAKSLGYRPASVRDSVLRFAREQVSELAAAGAGTMRRG